MNLEKKNLQNVQSAGEYLAPRVKVVKAKSRRIMCSSPTGGAESESEESLYD